MILFKSRSIRFFLLIQLFLFKTGFIFAQVEQLFPLQTNLQLKQFWHNQKNQNINSQLKTLAINDTIKIPFIDDFSYDSLFPSPDLWSDSNVFLNSNFPMHPPSVGVATFDGMDKFGNPYDGTNQGANGLCDELTSKPINLFDDGQGNPYQLGDSIWLSFFVQRKGKGNSVETTDSLMVSFYDISAAQWQHVWSLKGGVQDTVFTRVTIKIEDSKWLYNGFRFKFSAYGSKSGNLDHWHIDYVMLRKVFSPYDNNIDDVAWSFKSTTMLNDYVSVPWNHYVALSPGSKAALMKQTQQLFYANINENPANIRLVSNIDGIFDQLGNQLQLTPGTNTNNIYPQHDTTYVYSLNNFVFPDNLPPTGDAYEFNIVNRLSTTPDANRKNDTIRYKQTFESYYAYDDGSAEAGYSLYPSPTGKFAMRFDLLQADTIRGVKICFSPVSPNTTNNLFRLAIWTQLLPAEVKIYQQSNLHPAFIDEVNGFAYYPINDTDLVLSGSVYIGIVQQTANYYGFGFDINTDNNSRMYYNTNFGWTNSTIPGTWMIRPVFGDSALIAGFGTLTFADDYELKIIPNPAKNQIEVTCNALEPFKLASVSVFSIEGRLVFSDNKTVSVNHAFDLNISDLKQGVYFINVNTGKQILTRKLVKL